MDGPFHYQEAERLLAGLYEQRGTEQQSVLLAAAQVHASLALAAAWNETAPIPPETDDEDGE